MHPDEQSDQDRDGDSAYEAPAIEERVELTAGPLIGVVTSGPVGGSE